MFYSTSTLANGLTVLSENMSGVRSITLGIWFKVGSRDELDSEAGISHFMEHMLFKGTPTRTAADISMEFDSMGAELNAFTSREYTCFYARFVDEYLERAIEILADMLLNSSFAPDDVASERKVVIEEIARCEDMPDEHVFDLLGGEMFPNCSLGRPVLGYRESVGGFTHDDLLSYHQKHYHAANCTVAASGNVDHAKLSELVEKYLGQMPAGQRNVRPEISVLPASYLRTAKKDTEQANILFGIYGLPLGHEDRFAQALLDSTLGGGMSSRLFQEVREKRGLAYSVYSLTSSFQGIGMFNIYAGTQLQNLPELIQIVNTELAKMLDGGVAAEELERVRAYAIGQSILSMESTRTRMLRLGRASVGDLEILSLDDNIDRYKRVTVQDIERITSRILDTKPVIAIVSSASDEEIRKLIEDVV